MSDIPIGVLDGNDTTDPHGGVVVTAAHGYDNGSPYDTDYNNIYHENNNRWHIQSYWDQEPEGGATSVFYIDSSNFRIDDTSSTANSRFSTPHPTEAEMEDNYNNRYPYEDEFEVIVESAPYIGTGVALINQKYETKGSLDPGQMNNNYFDWHIPQGDSGLPTSQSEAVGVRFNVYSEVGSDYGYQGFDVDSDHNYVHHDGYTPTIYNTGGIDADPYYYPLD